MADSLMYPDVFSGLAVTSSTAKPGTKPVPMALTSLYL
ncbi:hypothetical protein Barb7_02062 [Bacteroidales bacterium Barb7]|nr:hypothetical protein Barb7_02062 [Bacteroidales bacterium Barb7]